MLASPSERSIARQTASGFRPRGAVAPACVSISASRCGVPVPERLEPGPPLGPRRGQRGEPAQEGVRRSRHGERRPPVSLQILGAAVRGDERCPAPDLAAVVEAEVAGHAGQHHEVRLAQGLLAPVAELERAGGSQQAARHAREIDRQAERVDGRDQLVHGGGLQQCLAAHEQHGTIRAPDQLRRAAHARLVRPRRDDGSRGADHGRGHPAEEPTQVPVEIPALGACGEPAGHARRLGAVPAAHDALGIEQVHRDLDEDGAGHALGRDAEGLLEHGRDFAQAHEAARPLHVRPHERHLVDVLQRATAAQQRRRSASDQQQRGLRESGVLQGGDRVRDARSRGDDGDPGPAAEARSGVRGEDRGRLVARVDDAHAARLGRDQDRRDVPAAQREQEAHAVADERFRDQLAAAHATSRPAVRQGFPASVNDRRDSLGRSGSRPQTARGVDKGDVSCILQV